MLDTGLILRLSDDGYAVIAIAGQGEAISPEMVHAQLDQEGFGDYYLMTAGIEQFCQQLATGSGPVTAVVAERRDGEVIVTVTADGNAAYLTLTPPFGGKPHNRADIVTALEKAGVKTGILPDAVERASRLMKTDKLLIAQARPGIPGEPARFTPLVEPGGFVTSDTPIMRRTPPTNGKPGESVTGQPLPPIPGIDLDWGTLSGCAPASDNHQLLIATQDGLVHFGAEGAQVVPSCRIDVTVAPDGLGAFLSFAPMPGGRSPSRVQLARALAAAGVRAGLLEAALDEAASLPAINNYLVAQAILPSPGEPERFVPLVPADTFVDKGTPIMRKLPPGQPKPGRRVTGEPLPPPEPAPPKAFAAGDGTQVDPQNPELLRASHPGQVRFAARGATVVRACHVSIQVSPDGLVAYLNLREGTGDAEQQWPIINEALMAAGVTTGLIDEALAEAAASTQVSGLLVARGEKPQRGVDGRIDVLADPQVRVVAAGTPLVRRIPAIPGAPGVTVHGETIPSAAAKEAPPIDVRPGTMPGEDPHLIVAAIAGQVLIGENWVEVSGIRQVETVSADETIVSDESVVITGSVESGGTVKSRGDVVVMGDVTGANVEADGSIEIHGLISGNAVLRARGPIKVSEVHDAQLESDAGITVSDGLHRANVTAAGPVEAGTISGGRISSMSSVNAEVIGNADGEPTTIAIGPSPVWQMKANKAKAARAAMQTKVDETSRGLIHMKLKGRDHAHPQTMRLLEAQRAKQVDEVEALKLDEDRLLNAMNTKGPGQVVARELVHPGVTLTFSHLAQSLHLTRTVETDVPGAVFSVRGGQIIAVPSVRETIRPAELPINQANPSFS